MVNWIIRTGTPTQHSAEIESGVILFGSQIIRQWVELMLPDAWQSDWLYPPRGFAYSYLNKEGKKVQAKSKVLLMFMFYGLVRAFKKAITTSSRISWGVILPTLFFKGVCIYWQIHPVTYIQFTKIKPFKHHAWHEGLNG